MQRTVSRRVDAISESPTMAVSARARELKAAGEPVIGFGAGEPDFPTPDHVVAAAAEACRDPATHRYSPAPGLPELREAVADKTARDSGLEVTPGQVVITNGAKHALLATFTTLLDPGDEVLLPAPYWVSYPEQIRFAGGQPVVLPTTPRTGFRVGVDELERASSDRTRALVLSSPSNPTGAVYPPAELVEIGRWAARREIWVITDEIYEHLVYGQTEFASLPVVAPEAAERCVVVNGVSKSYAMTGWRVGWLIAPEPVASGAARLQSHATSNVCNVAQRAALAALTGPQDHLPERRETFDRRRRITVDRLSSLPGVTCTEPQGAFYAFPRVEDLLGGTVDGREVHSSLQLAEVLLEAAKVAVVPGEGFGAPGYLRLSYALGEEDLVEGLDRLAAALG